jgi:ATP synthase I chain
MLADFPVLYVDLIVRRTIASCIVLAVVAVLASILLGQPLAGVGVLLGLGAATVNHRLFQLSTVRYSSEDGHIARKPYAGSVAGRLGAITLVAFALLYFVRPMGFGMIGGLVAFQVLLMANALAALWRYQRLQLAGLAPANGAEPGATEGQGTGPGAAGDGFAFPGQTEGDADV